MIDTTAGQDGFTWKKRDYRMKEGEWERFGAVRPPSSVLSMSLKDSCRKGTLITANVHKCFVAGTNPIGGFTLEPHSLPPSQARPYSAR
jgi:hypothetical protein